MVLVGNLLTMIDMSELFGGRPGELTMQAVDKQSVTFHSAGGRTELRLHPDEAPLVLRALAS